ncbi:MAG: DUF4280 domain-containing protein [Chitinophaga sp.]|uniref:PAAR-like protein n=1 Tax=Chitinophaga sp. TaxID=1869181 RepID=UPI001B0C8929|nr:PAAR-like protein [Chitinophaga sp.]MBO9729202.1 DUF4280 domain-containing protein [Chitinophaga sp.]
MADKHFVVQGAICKCSFGNTSSQLQVAAATEYINDYSSTCKAVASTKETGLPFLPPTFGMCKLSHNTCVPAITKWLGYSSNITLSNNGQILTEDSKAICAISGSPCISISHHGQTTTVSSASLQEAVDENTSALNPLVPVKVPLQELPEVRSITLKLKDRTLANTYNSYPIKDNTPPEVIVRMNESLSFYISQYNNPGKADESLVSWKVYDDHSNHTAILSFEKHGPSLDLKLDKAGKYRVVAYGAEQTGNTAYLDITATCNRLKEAFIITGGVTDKTEGKIHPVKIAAAYIITPPTQPERQSVSFQIADTCNNIIAISATDSIHFTPPNTTATYLVSAMMCSDHYTQTVTRPLAPEKQTTISKTNHLIRPRTSLQLHVDAVIPGPLECLGNTASTQWTLNGKKLGTGSSITMDGDTYFTLPGKYLVEARLSYPTSGACSTEMVRQGSWKLEVKNNEILHIKVVNGTTNWIIGKFYQVSVKTLMPYDASLDGHIMWAPYGAGGPTLRNAVATQPGHFTITASLGTSKQTLEINACYASITRWCFADQEGIYKAIAGWQENINIIISAPMAANETVRIHLLQANLANRIYHIKDLGLVSFDGTGELKLNISTYSLKPLLTALSFEWDTFNLLFAIEQVANSIQFSEMKTIQCGNKKYWFPRIQNSKRNEETGKLLRIKAMKEVTGVTLYDSHNHPAYKVYKYGEKIKIHIQTSNLAKEKLLLQIWENKFLDEDQCRYSNSLTINEDELCNIVLDTRILKTGNQLEDSFYRCFYVVIKTAGNKFLYPAEIADANMLNPNSISFYQHIKLSDRLDRLLNQLSHKNAPAVLGEPLAQDTFVKECPRCNEDIRLAQLKSMFPQASNTDLQIVADTYNRYMAAIGMNTCWNKAHFFAQVGVESGRSLHIRHGESFNWYWEDLCKHFSAFNTVEGKKKAKEWGRSVRKPASPGVSDENQENIANYAYGPDTATGKMLGNTGKGDGWHFRGRGLIQITGRDAYAFANTYTSKEKADIINHPDLVSTDMKIAVLSAMTFWKWKGIQHMANRQREITTRISQAVGKRIISGGKSNYEEKNRFFKNNTAIVFQVSSCEFSEAAAGNINRYVIHADTFFYKCVEANPDNNKYQYDVYLSNRLVKSFHLEKNKHGLLPFPETGPNWGRYGDRDRGGDNYIAPHIAAPLFGFFYSLPLNGFKEMLYYNDISASDKRNIGHRGHIDGNDIDIRYPGSTNRGGEVLWSEAKKAYKSEKEFIGVLENILSVAQKWNFKINYAFKKKIRHTIGKSMNAHQNHFHIGLRENKTA